MSPSPEFSIIVPTLDEERRIGRLLRYLRWVVDSGSFRVELVVADGGSRDRTRQAAHRGGADRLVISPRGRAAQMNAGAQVARGRVLYFLHADTLPDADFLRRIAEAVATGVGCGCLRLRFDRAAPLLRVHSWLVRLRWWMLRFGDQSLFVVARHFHEAGGFRTSLFLFEDQEIVRRLRRRCQFAVLRSRITASDRAFRQSGLIRTHVAYYLLLLAFAIGASQSALAAMRAQLLREPPR